MKSRIVEQNIGRAAIKHELREKSGFGPKLQPNNVFKIYSERFIFYSNIVIWGFATVIHL